jgi:hypothetical protein
VHLPFGHSPLPTGLINLTRKGGQVGKELLSRSEAARVLSEGLGRPIKIRNVQDVAKRGRPRAEKAGGLRSPYRTEEAEVLRVLKEVQGKEKPWT